MIHICTAYLNYRDFNSDLLFFSDILIRFGPYVNTLSFYPSLHLCLCQLSFRNSLSPLPLSIATLLLNSFLPFLSISVFLCFSPSLFFSLSAEAKPHPSVKRAKCWRHTKTTYPAAVKSYFNLNIHSMEREVKVD